MKVSRNLNKLGILRQNKMQMKKNCEKVTVLTLMKEYSKNCTLHGVQYMFKEDATVIERFLWLVVVFSCFICASLLVYTMWVRFSLAPTVTAVKDTHLPLYSFPFPAVSICPTDKIKRIEAFKYISKYVNVSLGSTTYNDSLDHFFSALTLFQHPSYSRMLEHLKRCSDILPLLSTINLTDFMLQVMPQCNEVFDECSWHGLPENCCELFHVQRSEEGFCYSFNSFTSHSLDHCPQSLYGTEDQSAEIDLNCVLRRNTAAGTATGMEVFLKHFDETQYLVNRTSITGNSGVKVQLHSAVEYPEAGMGVLVQAIPGIKMTASIRPHLTESTDSIRSLTLAERNCFFPDEMQLSLAVSYSQKTCLIECRLQYFNEVCGCRPYYFNMIDDRIPTCNASQLQCIADHGVAVRFFRPPAKITRGFDSDEIKSPLKCSNCLPTCHESYYDLDIDITSDTQPLALQSYGYLDLYYKYGGAVKYQRDVTFGWIDLLVSFGGIAGLFLGFSLLSVVELLYWATKFSWLGFQSHKASAIKSKQIKVMFNKNVLY